MKADDLKVHPFVSQCWSEVRALNRNHEENGVDPNSEDINELEFYMYRVGHSLAHLVTWMEQLQDVPSYLADFNYKGAARANGITRARYLLYTVENYLVRLQSIYDRCLQLTNSVFHLCIEDSNVGHALVVSNLQVSRTDIPARLKRVKKSVSDRQSERNRIVHHASYQEKDLDRLQLFYLYNKDTWVDEKVKFENFSYMRSQLLRKVVSAKRKEFESTNESLAVSVNELLTGLHAHYDKYKSKIGSFA